MIENINKYGQSVINLYRYGVIPKRKSPFDLLLDLSVTVSLVIFFGTVRFQLESVIFHSKAPKPVRLAV